MTYEETLEYIHSLYWRGKKSGLEKTRELLELCGHPERYLRCVHIAGTNGKGSTAAMLASVCQCAGLKVGLYTSPYIVRYNERVQVNGQEIPDEKLSELTEYLAELVEQMEVPPSEFEFGTVLAFLYFKEQNCNLVILETGLGGTFDSTNVIENPLLCIITALGLDHTAQLGSSLTEIAEAKAGIIKPGAPVVFYGDCREGEEVIGRRCAECEVSFVTPSFSEIVSESFGTVVQCQQFSYKKWKHVLLALPGLYQQRNAALVLEATEQLESLGISIPEQAVRDGLQKVHWQARLEVLRNRPLLLADGSHNPQGMQATLESLRLYFPDRKLQFIFGAMADKELDTMAAMFLPMAKKVYLTAPAMPRAKKAEELLTLCRQKCAGEKQPELFLCPKVEDALQMAEKEAEEEVIIVIGSLYLVGEVKKRLSHQ